MHFTISKIFINDNVILHTVLKIKSIENVQSSVTFPNEDAVANTSFSPMSGTITIPVEYLQEVAQGFIKK